MGQVVRARERPYGLEFARADTQVAFLLCDENTDDLPAQFRHTHPARIGDAFEPDHRCRRDMKLHSELTTGTILGRQPRPHDDGTVAGVLAYLAIPARLSDLVTTAVGVAIRLLPFVVAEVIHSDHARPRRTRQRRFEAPAVVGGGACPRHMVSR